MFAAERLMLSLPPRAFSTTVIVPLDGSGVVAVGSVLKSVLFARPLTGRSCA